LVLGVDSSFPQTEPGEFVQVACRDLDSDVSGGPGAFLRRPFSLAGRVDRPDRTVELHLIHRVVGVGTQWLAERQPGDRVNVLGPLGNRFTPPPAGGTALLVGGGVGIPPMLYLAEKLAGRKAVAFAGALSRDLLPLTITDDAPPASNAVEPRLNVEDFARYGIPTILSTDDGSIGFRGFITQALERYLDDCRADSTVIYTCGPEPMMKRVADIAAARGIECQVAVERAMACGMGTCQSCCIRVRKPDPDAVPLPGKDWCWRLACTDGPVFRGADLLW
jgi:dihydroorotate dehydrogenase electron transfer subunit